MGLIREEHPAPDSSCESGPVQEFAHGIGPIGQAKDLVWLYEPYGLVTVSFTDTVSNFVQVPYATSPPVHVMYELVQFTLVTPWEL